ncbi:OmpA family protein [Fulvivirgaceae bacterium BMA12]|uniref:OmpA family protein n=1 Tax=Agaribacillus aureus TaxID=3051825 RepID=A0ABT8L985_9BACT|nr:OmpA family protein [Fulvivirgaceae bacterium BMA12]
MVKNAFVVLLLIYVKIGSAQELAPTLTEALLKVKVTDLNDIPSQGEIITFINKQNQRTYEGITDTDGMFQILIPKGCTYIVQYRNFGYDHQYAEHEIPSYEGKLVSKINIKYRLPSKTVLEGVSFESDNITLSSQSFGTLNKLVELLKVKQHMSIRLAAHNDGKGGVKASQLLTEKQAVSVKNYLVSEGIAADRLAVIGYGGKFPMASNQTPQGRAKNRRIEVEIIKK